MSAESAGQNCALSKTKQISLDKSVFLETTDLSV